MESYTDRLKDGLIAVALNEMKPEVEKQSYDVQKRYDDLVMLCKQCFAYEDEEMLEKLKEMAFELCDDIEEGIRAKERRKYEYVLKANSHISEEVLLIALSRKYDCSAINADLDAELTVLFRQVWLSGKSTASVVEALREFLKTADPFAVTLVTYALMLRCVRYYDHSFVELLMELKTAEAFAALAVILMIRSERIAYDKRERELFAKFYDDDMHNSLRIVWALEDLIKTYETKQIAEEFESKIYPEVARKRQDLNIDQMLNEGKKPDWEGMLEGTPLISKMRKINDMQLSGKDVNYATFKAMKGYPFFSETSHWFYPFNMSYWGLGSVKGMDEKGVEVLSKAANLCDSDRYSLFLMFKAMGINDMGGALGNMGIDKLSDLNEMVGEKWQESEEKRFILQLRYAVMNIYRFYNIAPNHSDFESPFEKRSLLIEKVLPASTVYVMAKAAYQIGDYHIAIVLFEKCVDEMIDEDASIYEKMGFCYLAVGASVKAIEYYDKASILEPDSLNVLRGLANSYIDEGNDLMNIKTRKKIEEIEPDDLENLYQLAISFESCELYEDALTRLYKCEYQSPEYRYWVLMARVLYKMGRYEESAKYYDKACGDDEFLPEDLFEAALNDLMMEGKRAEALLRECYKILNNVDDFMMIYENDFAEEVEALDEKPRKRFTNLINKIIIDL